HELPPAFSKVPNKDYAEHSQDKGPPKRFVAWRCSSKGQWRLLVFACWQPDAPSDKWRTGPATASWYILSAGARNRGAGAKRSRERDSTSGEPSRGPSRKRFGGARGLARRDGFASAASICIRKEPYWP